MRQTILSTIIALLLGASSSSEADHDLGVYWFGRILVVDRFVPGSHEIRVIDLSDARDLTVAATLKTRNDFSFDGYAHWQDYLLVVVRNRVEVYDLSTPADASKVATIRLHKSDTVGTNGVALLEDRLTAVTYCCSGRIELKGDPSEWVADQIKEPPQWPEDLADYSWPPRENTVVRTSDGYVYELVWNQHETPDGAIWHELMLQKRRLKSRQLVSLLFLGETLETRGE